MRGFEEYFHRQIELWGSQRQKSLQSKSIAIIGAGGLGSTLALALGTSGIGKVYMVDFDTISTHNIHRQIAFTMHDEGRFKSKVVTELLLNKNPFLECEYIVGEFGEFKNMHISVDLILDATDNLKTRYEIDEYAKQNNTPWIYGSVEEFNGQVCFIDESNFEIFPLSDHKPGGITAPIVMHIGSLQANLALRYLAGLSVKRDMLYYLYFDENGELVTQKYKMPN